MRELRLSPYNVVSLSVIDEAIVDALDSDRFNGVASEDELNDLVARSGESGSYGVRAHTAKNFRALWGSKGVLERIHVGVWLICFTDAAWHALGHEGPAPRPQQEAMF